LQAGHEDDGGRLGRQIEGGIGTAHQLGHFLVHHTDQGLARGQGANDFLAKGLLLHGGNEVLDHRQRHVRLQQGEADLAQGVGNIGFRQTGFTPEGLHDTGEALSQIIEHGQEVSLRGCLV